MKHIHRLKKHSYPKTGGAIFFCVLPDCGYKVDAPLALGKETLCNICGEPFLMNEYTLRLLRPHCVGCGRREVKDANGKKRYVYVKRGSEILTAVAADEVNSLRDRLDGLTRTDEDI